VAVAFLSDTERNAPIGYVCPAEGSSVVLPCETGETKRVWVKRRRFTHVQMHIRNICIA
jgi:hypothetical protein